MADTKKPYNSRWGKTSTAFSVEDVVYQYVNSAWSVAVLHIVTENLAPSRKRSHQQARNKSVRRPSPLFSLPSHAGGIVAPPPPTYPVGETGSAN